MNRSMSKRRVVITGRGVVSPLGVGVENHGKNLLAGRCAIRRSERLSATGCPPFSAGEIPQEEWAASLSLIPHRQRKLMNRAGLLAAVAASLAAEEAGIKNDGEGSRLGVFLSTWLTAHNLGPFVRYLAGTDSEQEPGVMDAIKANTGWLEKMNPVDSSLKIFPNLSAGHLAILHQAQGCTEMIADSWRGGFLAVAQASEAIRYGELDRALAGGAEAPLEEGIFSDLCGLDFLARDEEEGDEVCRPFDISRRGALLGEGAGVVVLEERERALARGAAIYGEIVGWASSAPGSEENGKGPLVAGMKRALAVAALGPEEVDFIHANGDSTLEHDRAEVEAVKALFGSYAAALPVTATKSLHGHLLSAAGAVELISSLLMLETGVIVFIANCGSPDEGCGLDLVLERGREKTEMKTALLNGVGLFGEAASLVIQR